MNNLAGIQNRCSLARCRFRYMFTFFSNIQLTLCVARDAWSSLGNMTKEEAMKNYVEDIQLVSPFRGN